MSKIRIEIVDTFRARNAADDVFELIVFQEFHHSGTLSNPDQWAEGLKSIELQDGRPVNKIDENTFEVFDTRERLMRI